MPTPSQYAVYVCEDRAGVGTPQHYRISVSYADLRAAVGYCARYRADPLGQGRVLVVGDYPLTTVLPEEELQAHIAALPPAERALWDAPS